MRQYKMEGALAVSDGGPPGAPSPARRTDIDGFAPRTSELPGQLDVDRQLDADVPMARSVDACDRQG